MIIRGGENIYPREIEEFLYNMPGVRDVQVVGVRVKNTAKRSVRISFSKTAQRLKKRRA
jgi:acyl-CoA synthetase (AMP-forming)/AMP-acid ligase II